MTAFPSRFTQIILLYVLFYGVKITYQSCRLDAYTNRTSTLTFFAHKNQTGHYVTEWLVTKESEELPDNVKIEVKSSKMVNRGIQMFKIQGILTSMPVKPASYELFPGVGYYKFYPEGALDYFQALSTCLNDGAHLAILNSEAESAVIRMLYSRYPKVKDWAYVGFHDLNEEGKFFTIFGEPLAMTGFSRWYAGQPDNYEGIQNCGAVHRNGLLNDLYCEKGGPWPFICEYDFSWG